MDIISTVTDAPYRESTLVVLDMMLQLDEIQK